MKISLLSSPFFYPELDIPFSGSALNRSSPFSGSAFNASPHSTDAHASARHESKITFELYGADTLSKPARRVVERLEGMRAPLGEGPVEGGLPGTREVRRGDGHIGQGWV
ncbi:hypothetical protein OUZ56_011334 [Daphnia magna]|uniref:Uncharacterized protein n=1 Tax=Daphnia magna TaxID=35525 RepID=A0ABQ9YZW1_9CRUS|nr:hypothetical protein OUZ56_011334 [Daphnia magna]